VAPLEADARLERLVWAIDQLGVVRKDLQHVLVGAGAMRRRLLRRARVHEIVDRLVVVPHCGLLPDLLGQVRLVWQSGTVALGGAVLDAMAGGVPVVAVAGDAAGQFVADGETGWIAPPLPESELPRRAFKILEDEPLAARMGAAAAARAAASFPAAASVAAHVALHERLAG
jgi:glycosyltransferase involved in cell wall biosynthesis